MKEEYQETNLLSCSTRKEFSTQDVTPGLKKELRHGEKGRYIPTKEEDLGRYLVEELGCKRWKEMFVCLISVKKFLKAVLANSLLC